MLLCIHFQKVYITTVFIHRNNRKKIVKIFLREFTIMFFYNAPLSYSG